MNNNSTIATTPEEYKVIELRKSGMAIASIMAQTGVTERRIKALIKDVVKGKKASKKAPPPPSPLSRAADRAFPLACRKQGIRDHELRLILHEEYGTNPGRSDGVRKSNYNSDTITRLKDKVRKRAVEEDCDVIFTADWIDEQAPRLSSNYLISAATDLMSRIEEYVTEYMGSHGIRREENDDTAVLDRRKQRYSAEQHLLGLALRRYSPEPVEKLLARTERLVRELEGAPDLPSDAKIDTNKAASVKTVKIKDFTESSGANRFLDDADQEGWLI